MKILKLLTRIDQTGMTVNCLDLSEEFVKDGHEVFLVVGDTFEKDPKLKYLYDRIDNSGIKIFTFSNKENSSVFDKISTTISIISKILQVNPDVIHTQSPYLSFIPWLIRKKFISTIHVPDLEKRFEYKNATIAIAISKETNSYAINKFNYLPAQVELVYHGVSSRFIKPITNQGKIDLKKKLSIPANNIIIGLVGSIEKRKGHDILLNAIDDLSEANRNRITVLFLGSYKNGISSGWIEKLIESSLIKDNIILLEYQEPKPFYDIIDIFVLPSRLEGFPLVAIEAMLSECCVIRSNVEGAYDQIIDKETGFLFENENIQGLSLILENLIVNDDLRMKTAAKAKEYAIKNFTAKVMAANTLNVYKKLLNKNKE